MEVRKIRREELLVCSRLDRLAFENGQLEQEGITPESHAQAFGSNDRNRYEHYWYEKWAGFTEDGALMGCISTLPYEVYFDGHVVPMSGISSVCTYPQYRRGGVIRECFRAALPDMVGCGQVFSFLYPFSQSYYRQYGYTAFEPSAQYRLNLKYIRKEAYGGSFSLYEGEGELPAFMVAYDRFAPQYNLMVRREAMDYGRLYSAKPYENNTFAYLYKDAAGIPAGYLVFAKEREGETRLMRCREFVFADYEALSALLNFAALFAADYDYIVFDAPLCIPVEHLCTDYAQSRSRRTLSNNGMARVVNVGAALELAAYRGEGDVTVAVEDAWIAGNSGVWRIECAGGAAVHVERLEGASPDDADAIMSIGDFTSALCGRYAVSDLAWMPEVRVKDAGSAARLERLFYPKPLFINTFF